VVVWTFNNTALAPTSPLEVRLKAFQASGLPASAPEQTVAAPVAGALYPDVAMRADGRFAVTWRGDNSNVGIFAKLYDSNVSVLKQAFPVALGNLSSSRVAFRPDGGFTVVWQDASSGQSDILARHYGANGDPFLGLAQPSGNAFLVNTFTSGDQSLPSVDFSRRGEFVVAWTSPGSDNSSNAVAFRRYLADGSADGDDRVANTFTLGNQQTSTGRAVSMDPAGNIVIAWASDGQDGSGSGCYAEKFYLPNQGPPLSEFRVNTTTAGDQRDPSSAADAAGEFVVAWSDNQDIFFQLHNADGIRRGSERKVLQPLIPNSRSQPSVAMDQDGDFVIVWSSQGQDGSGFGVYGQVFNRDGNSISSELQVSDSFTSDDQWLPAVDMDSLGNFAVAWMSRGQRQNGLDSVQVRRYLVGGVSNGVISVSDADGAHHRQPAVLLREDGSLVVTWAQVPVGDTGELLARIFAADGQFAPPTINVNTTTANDQGTPAIDGDINGNFVIVWNSDQQDGSARGVYCGQFTANGARISGPAGEQETLVNTGHNQNNQYLPSVAVAPNGKFIVTWTDFVDASMVTKSSANASPRIARCWSRTSE